MFHVKHAPIEVAAAHLGRAADQEVAVRFHHDDREHSTELAQLRYIRAIDTTPPMAARALQPQTVPIPVGTEYRSVNLKRSLIRSE